MLETVIVIYMKYSF